MAVTNAGWSHLQTDMLTKVTVNTATLSWLLLSQQL